MKKITFKEVRKIMGYSDLEMAVKFKISPSTIYWIDKGRYPSMRLLRHIYHQKASGPYREDFKSWVMTLLEEK